MNQWKKDCIWWVDIKKKRLNNCFLHLHLPENTQRYLEITLIKEKIFLAFPNEKFVQSVPLMH